MGMRELINSGHPQRAAIIFSDSLDILGNERILLENGFTLTQTYCTSENLQPGNVGGDTITVNVNNDDGALTGFDFDRMAGLLLGVEDDSEDAGRAAFSDSEIAVMLFGVEFGIRQDNTIYYKVGGVAYGMSVYADNFFVKYTTSNVPYYDLYVINNGRIRQHFKITQNNNVTNPETLDVELSSYSAHRFSYLRSINTCEVWNLVSSSLEQLNEYTVYDRSIAKTAVYYTIKSSFKCEQPRSTSGAIVSFVGASCFSALEENAKTYISQNWNAPKSLYRIALDLLVHSVGTYEISFPSEFNNIIFSTNPFASLDGVTYKDLFKIVLEAVGGIAEINITGTIWSINEEVAPYFSFSTNIFISKYMSPGSSDPDGIRLSQDEYMSYDIADCAVQYMQSVNWKKASDPSGRSSGGSLSHSDVSTGVSYSIVGNPLYEVDNSISSQLLNLAFRSTEYDHFGGYRPCNVTTHLGALVNVGHTITITLEDGSTAWFPAFVSTITWNGGADCVIESTGKEYYNQYDDYEFRLRLQNYADIVNIIDETGQSSITQKHNIEPLPDVGEVVDKLVPVSFNYNDDLSNADHYGLIFEDTIDVLPTVCINNVSDKKKRINYVEIVPVLLRELQSLRKRVAELETSQHDNRQNAENQV